MTFATTKPQRIQLRRAKGWRMPADAVKVDRTTPWGNPFIVGKHGTQAECVDLYRKLMAGYLCISTGDIEAQAKARAYVAAHRKELRGKSLACWCRPGTPCHADVLIEIANESAGTA